MVPFINPNKVILPSDENIGRNRSRNEWGGNFPPIDKKNSESVRLDIYFLKKFPEEPSREREGPT
jgi:hypothetical protein